MATCSRPYLNSVEVIQLLRTIFLAHRACEMAETPRTSLHEAGSNPAIYMVGSESRSDLTTTSNALLSWIRAGLRFAADDPNLIRAKARCLDSQGARQGFSPRCKPCNKRKIRCLPAPKGPQSRCLNCIRLKKECIPVTEEDTVDLNGLVMQYRRRTMQARQFPLRQGLLRRFVYALNCLFLIGEDNFPRM